jgi:hypothetical protein
MTACLQVQAVDVTTNLGTLPVLPPGPPMTGTITHSGVAAFSDTFNFTLLTSGLSGLIADFAISAGVGSSYDISSLTATLYNGFNASGSSIETLAGSGTGTVNDSVNNLTAGNAYSIRVSGTPIGSLGGIYAYSFAATVPEVETWAMMLVGLGLVGLRLRRKTGTTRAIRA